MKPILLLLVSFVFSSAIAQTNVSGGISSNTIWTKANSPYIIKGNVGVDTGTTLTIESGVTVKFDGYFAFYVDGKIVANGTSTDNIRIVSGKAATNKNEWHSILIKSKSLDDTSVFNYCVFSNANEGVHVDGPSVQFLNCTFDNNIVGISYNTSHFAIPERRFSKVAGCTFKNNDNGISNFSMYGGDIVDNTFSDNVNGVSFREFSVVNIKNNRFLRNQYGLRLICAGGIPIVQNNIIHDNKYGIYLSNSTSSILADTMMGNEIFNNRVGLLIATSSGNIVRNTIYQNDTAIYYYLNNKNLNFKENCIDNSKKYQLVCGQTTNIDISGNYWGTTDSLLIDKAIVDWYDNVTCGRASFSPYLTTNDGICNKTSTGIKESVTNTLSMNVYPNPAKDILNITVGTRPASGAYLFVYNLAGVTIHKMPVTSDKLTVNTAQWVPGVYMLRLVNEQETAITKIVKE